MTTRYPEAIRNADPATLERLARLLAAEQPTTSVSTAEEGAALLMPHLLGHEAERLVVAALDRRYRVIDTETLTIGSDGFTIVCPKSILRWALTRKRLPSALIIGHNHPSGDATPSPQDIEVTRRIEAACRVVGIPLVDHIVVGGPNKWTSFAKQGRIVAMPERLGVTLG
jgi:DNA repair protein RadC